MTKVRAQFSRKPQVSGVKINGTITRKGGGDVSEADASTILQRVVDAIDGTSFETETLSATLG